MKHYFFFKLEIVDGENSYTERVLTSCRSNERIEDCAEAIASQYLGRCDANLDLPELTGEYWRSVESDDDRLVKAEFDSIVTVSKDEFDFLNRFVGYRHVDFPFSIKTGGTVFKLKTRSVNHENEIEEELYENPLNNETLDPLEIYCHLAGINIKSYLTNFEIESWIDADFS